MSAEPTQPNAEQGDDSDGNVDIKALREAAKAGKADRAENEQLKRELAFAKAGVDTDSKIGSMLFKTYEGDLTDVAALQAEWSELNPAAKQAPPDPSADPETAPTPEGFQDPSQQQKHREGTQGSGTPAGDTPKTGPDPYDAAFEAFHGNKALPLEERQEGAVAGVLSAYFQGDKRVMFDRNAHLAAAQAAARDDVDPGA